MSLFALANHLLSFMAPAVTVAAVVTLGARLALRGLPQRPRWRTSFALDLIAGVVALGLGLWLFGHDGKMATYGLLVVAVATCEWFGARGWRS